MFRSEVDAASVLASRVVCEPLHLWMLCSPNEGAAAVVLTAADARAASTGSTVRARCRGPEVPPARPGAERVDADVGA